MSKLIEPEDVLPTAAGFVVGIGIVVLFVLLVTSMGLPTLIDHHAIPHQ